MAICDPRHRVHNFHRSKSSTWAHNVRLHIAGTNESKSAQQSKQGALLSLLSTLWFIGTSNM